MNKTLEILGSIVGAVGIVICLISGIARVAGGHWLFGFESFTLFIGGIGVMMAACLVKLQAITLQLNRRS